MAFLSEERLQQMERAHERVLGDFPDDIVAITMQDAVETIRAAWAERAGAVKLADGWRRQYQESELEVVKWRHKAADADQLACVREQERDAERSDRAELWEALKLAVYFAECLDDVILPAEIDITTCRATLERHRR